MFKFTPKTERELTPILEKGIYPFDVLDAQHRISQSGNEYILLTLKCYSANCRSVLIYDRMFPEGKMEYKLKHFCESIGMPEVYKKGEWDKNILLSFIGRSGEVKVYIQIDKTGTYEDKNAVIDYMLSINQKQINLYAALTGEHKIAKDDFNDDLPF